MTTIEIKHGDTTLPRYQLVGADGAPANLTGATIVQHLRGAHEDGLPCVIDGDPADGIVRLASRDGLPAPDGRGRLIVQFETEATFAGGQVQTFPEVGYDVWVIWPDLDAL